MKQFTFDKDRTMQLDIPDVLVIDDKYNDDKTFSVVASPSCLRANCCPKCGRNKIQQRGYKIRKIKDCIITADGVRHITIQYHQRQFSCRNEDCRCSFPETVSGLRDEHAATTRLQLYAYTMATAWNSCNRLAKEIGVSFGTIYRWKETVKGRLRTNEKICKRPRSVAISEVQIDKYTFTVVANLDDSTLIAFWRGPAVSLLDPSRPTFDHGIYTMKMNAIDCVTNAQHLVIDPLSSCTKLVKFLKKVKEISINPDGLDAIMNRYYTGTIESQLSLYQSKKFFGLISSDRIMDQRDCNFINRVLSTHADLMQVHEVHETFKLCVTGGRRSAEGKQLAQLTDFLAANGIVPEGSCEDIITMCFGSVRDFPMLTEYNQTLKKIMDLINKLIKKTNVRNDATLIDDVVDCVFFSNFCKYAEMECGYCTERFVRYIGISPFENPPQDDGFTYSYVGRGFLSVISNLEYKNELSEGVSSDGKWTPAERAYEGPVLC